MRAAASRAQTGVAVLMLLASVAYLTRFVPRGWEPHDEGMLGQAAERVLQGGVPHIDYADAYTGGLSWAYAAVFRFAGIDLLHLRWLLFAGAVFAIWLMYSLMRRHLQPIAAALATWVALGWSFPNYFAGLPSWWLLVCALECLWAFLRYLETGRLRYIALAGLAAGIAVAIKQTGLYLLIALFLSLLYEADLSKRQSSAWLRVERIVRWGTAATALIVAVAILEPYALLAEEVYLLLPVTACAVLLLRPSTAEDQRQQATPAFKAVLVAGAAAAVPLAILLMPYVLEGRLWDFVNGAFILPRKRLAFARMPMPSIRMILTGLPMLALVLPLPKSVISTRSRFFESFLWVAAVALPIGALWSYQAYQYIWQSSRALAALLPVAICYRLGRGHIHDLQQRRFLFASASMLAWLAMNQFPFASPIYFCYVAPLAVIAGVAVGRASSCLRPATIGPWVLMVLLFSLLSMHRGFISALGVVHVTREFDTPLALPRGHLNVAAEHAAMYRGTVLSVEHHRRGGPVIAGPDCPEIYFLSGLVNHSGASFDFFAADPEGSAGNDFADWSRANVIVVNHSPEFSPAPSVTFMQRLKGEFPNGEQFGKFEVRWR